MAAQLTQSRSTTPQCPFAHLLSERDALVVLRLVLVGLGDLLLRLLGALLFPLLLGVLVRIFRLVEGLDAGATPPTPLDHPHIGLPVHAFAHLTPNVSFRAKKDRNLKVLEGCRRVGEALDLAPGPDASPTTRVQGMNRFIAEGAQSTLDLALALNRNDNLHWALDMVRALDDEPAARGILADICSW